MPSTLLLDPASWDLVTDVNDNIAVASEPYSLSQDAASAIKTWFGECWWNNQIGVHWPQILGKNLPAALIKQELIDAALSVPGVVAAQVFLTSFTDRIVMGQVQVMGLNGSTQVANFVSVNPQGVG